MLKKIRRPSKYVVYAILIHITFLGLLIFSFDWTIKPQQPLQNVIQAVVVDESKLVKQAEKLKQEEKREKAAQRQRERQQQEAEQKRRQQKELAAKKKREQEEQAAELKKQKAEEQRKLRIKKEKEKQEAAEAARKAEEARLAKIKKEKEEAERKRKEEAEKKRKEEEARKRREEEEKRRKEEQRILQEQMAEEEALLTASRERRMRSVMAEYVEIIKQKVTRNWLRPAGSREGLECKVFVRLIPGGEVVDVRIIDGSGDPLFDRSVESAVLKASPLPLPSDPVLAERFRELQFIFNPEE